MGTTTVVRIQCSIRGTYPRPGLCILVLVFGGFLYAGSPDAVNALNPLFGTLPADRFSVVTDWEGVRTPEVPLNRTTNVFIGFAKDGKRMGTVVHMVTEGYGGSIALLVGFDRDGTVVNVVVVNHNETQCHIPGLSDGTMTSRYRGITLLDKLRLLVGKPVEKAGDVEAVTGATISSRAITEAVAEARITFYLVRSAGLLEKR